MSLLLDEFRTVIEKEKIAEEVIHMPTYSTGFDVMDYRNGRIQGNDLEIGFDGGRIITFIGKSGSGKTTLAEQIAINIAKKYEESNIIHMDYERASNMARIKALSGWSDEEVKKKYLLLNRGLYAESLYSLVKNLAKTKLSADIYEKIKIPTGKVDNFGKEVYTLPPTIVIVDSWALLAPKDIADESELSGSMSATSIAKTNNAIVKRLVGILEQANIMLFIINHITQKIEINAFSKTQAQVNYLKQDESIPGGTSCVYLATNVIKITTSTKLNEDEKYGIQGFMTILEYIKSRSNEAGRKFEMVFSQSDGFDNLLTNLNILNERKLLKGSPRAYYIEGAEGVKFTWKTFKEKYYENEVLRKVFDKTVKEVMMDFIPKPSDRPEEDYPIEEEVEENTTPVVDEFDDSEEIELIKCVDKKNDIWQGSDGHYYDGETGEEVEYTK